MNYEGNIRGGHIKLDKHTEGAFKRLSAWWQVQELGHPAILLSIPKPGKRILLANPFYAKELDNPDINIINLNGYWPSPDAEPDFNGLIEKEVGV